MTEPLAWAQRVTEIPETGLSEARNATSAERAAVAQALDAVSCEELMAEYTIRALGQGRYRMTGRLSAALTQTCVVSLDPVHTQIREAIDVAFWPAGTLPEPGNTEVEALSLPEIEPIENGVMATGRVLFDMLAASIDPYPRKAGVEFRFEDEAQLPGGKETGPFSALKKLRDES